VSDDRVTVTSETTVKWIVTDTVTGRRTFVTAGPREKAEEFAEGFRNYLAIPELKDLQALATASLDTWDGTESSFWWTPDEVEKWWTDDEDVWVGDDPDAAFIAAVNPRVVLGLIGLLRAYGYETDAEREAREKESVDALIARLEAKK
jgi:hypothetical protein